MRWPTRRRVRTTLAVGAALGAIAAVYWLGYRDGLKDQGESIRALVVLRRTPGSPNSSGSSMTWFDLRNPVDAARLLVEERRLKAAGADYYVAGARVEKHFSPEPDPRRVNSHR